MTEVIVEPKEKSPLQEMSNRLDKLLAERLEYRKALTHNAGNTHRPDIALYVLNKYRLETEPIVAAVGNEIESMDPDPA